MKKINEVGLIVDINTISTISKGGVLLTAKEIIELWKEEKILYYDSTKGNTPVVVKNNMVSFKEPLEIHLLKGDLV